MWFFRKKELPFPWSVWIAAAVVVLGKALFVIVTPMRSIASMTWLIDDSFIEMKVARNLGLGSGFSLDGIHATTGAPFFWIYLTSLNHVFFGKEAAIRATLIETSILGALAALVLFHLALKLTEDKRVAWTSFLFAMLTANAFFNGLNGMDTALFTLFLLLSVATYLGVGRPASWSPFAWGSVVGLFGGLTVMTRGDGIFLLFSLGVAQLIAWWRAPHGSQRDQLHYLYGLGLVSGVCFALFMAWQLMQTGSPFPGNQVGRREIAVAFHQFSFENFSLPHYLRIVVWNVFQLEELLKVATGGALLVFVALVYGCTTKKLRTLGLITCVYIAVFFGLLVGYQWYFANLHGLRYINPAVHLLFIFLAYFLWQLPWERARSLGAGIIIVAVLVLAGYGHYQICSRFPWSPYMSYLGKADPAKNAYYWGTIDWIRDNLTAGTIIGVRDYGRVSLFTEMRIQDLAGNIDPHVITARKDGTLEEYLKERNVEYLLIPTLEMRRDEPYTYLHENLNLQQVPEAPTSPFQYLYKIVW